MRVLLLSGLLCCCLTPSLTAAEIAPLVAKLKAIGKEGAGNVEAAQAWRQLSELPADDLIDVLTAFDDLPPLAANYLRAAVESIAERTLDAKKTLPSAKLEAFVKDTKRNGPARKLAYDYLVRLDPQTPARLLPGMLDDPGNELRREAVASLLKEIEPVMKAGEMAKAISLYQKALSHAAERDQVEAIAKLLAKLDVKVDLTKHFGFVTRWHIAASFDNRKGVGYAATYPPEKGVDLTATYKDRDGKEIRWQPHTTAAAQGEVDLNKVVAALHGTVAYAFAAVESAEERPVEVRAGSNNAVKLYLNGKEIYGREEYHHGMKVDQHVGRGVLKAGRNEILVKVLQNEQTESWAQRWSFQLRVTDHLGRAVPLTVVTEKTASKGE